MRNVMLLVSPCGAIWSSCGGVLITYTLVVRIQDT